MSQHRHSDASDRLGDLFEEITGRSTVTERQHRDDGRRTVEPTDEYPVDPSITDGLGDAVEMPEERRDGY